MPDKCAVAERKWTVMRIVKGLGSVYLAVGLMIAELTGWFLLMRYGIIQLDPQLCRVVLVLVLIAIVCTVIAYFEKTDPEDYIDACIGFVPWLLCAAITPILGFVLQSFEFLNIKFFVFFTGCSFLVQYLSAAKRVFDEHGNWGDL